MFNRKYKERIEFLENDNFELHNKLTERREQIDNLETLIQHKKIMINEYDRINKELGDRVELLKRENINLKRKNTILNKKVNNNE